MKTLDEAALDYIVAHSMQGQRPQHVVGNMYDSFMAGAAHMAERIAAGSFSAPPRQYAVEFYAGGSEPPEFRIVSAFSRAEAIRQLSDEVASNGAFSILFCRPATSEEIEKSKS
jgi:hypothetical protein